MLFIIAAHSPKLSHQVRNIVLFTGPYIRIRHERLRNVSEMMVANSMPLHVVDAFNMS